MIGNCVPTFKETACWVTRWGHSRAAAVRKKVPRVYVKEDLLTNLKTCTKGAGIWYFSRNASAARHLFFFFFALPQPR